MVGRKSGHNLGAGSSTVSERVTQLDAFCAGLFPILVAGDLTAFCRYLAQWEDVIGDTAELADASPETQRQTMATLLRRPQQFNLPPWPGTGSRQGRDLPAPAPEERAGDLLSGVDLPTVTDVPRTGGPRDAASAVSTTEVRPAGSAEKYASHDAAPEMLHDRLTEVPATAAETLGSYQVDMLTGELIPVVSPLSVRERNSAYTQPEGDFPTPKKRRRRRASHGLVQLTLWPGRDAAPGGTPP